jgi:hypothetical protein
MMGTMTKEVNDDDNNNVDDDAWPQDEEEFG